LLEIESFVGLPGDSLFTTPTELPRLHIFVQSEEVSRQTFLLNIATACDMMLICSDASAKLSVVLLIICKTYKKCVIVAICNPWCNCLDHQHRGTDTFTTLKLPRHLQLLTHISLQIQYSPKRSNIMLINHLNNFVSEKRFASSLLIARAAKCVICTEI
jgi:hypothetical protein